MPTNNFAIAKVYRSAADDSLTTSQFKGSNVVYPSFPRSRKTAAIPGSDAVETSLISDRKLNLVQKSILAAITTC